MNFRLIAFCPILVALITPVHAGKIPLSEDTTSPNMFWFSSAEYVVDEGETNLVITIQWSPGNRGYSGWVDYFSSDDTATAGRDYTAVSGRLYFSSPAAATFVIPIHADSIPEEEETIQLHLVNPDAIIGSNAVVRIQDVFVSPKMEIAANDNHTIQVSWAGQPSEFSLESSSAPNGSWTEISTTQALTNGRCYVSFPATNPIALFRLKKLP